MNGMKKDNVILDKSFVFAVNIVKLYQYLCDNKKEYVLSKQLLRCGTSIGANVNEAQAAQSSNDFIAKISIASKEARECQYWLNLLLETGFLSLSEERTSIVQREITEIIKLLTSIVKTMQEEKGRK